MKKCTSGYRAGRRLRGNASPARKLSEIIARLASTGPGIVMIAPGYSRQELIADLRAIEAVLRARQADEALNSDQGADL